MYAEAAGMGADQDDDCSFLDSVRYLLVGCTPAEESQALQIARQGGAARIQSLLPLLTHIIVSPSVSLSSMHDLRGPASAAWLDAHMMRWLSKRMVRWPASLLLTCKLDAPQSCCTYCPTASQCPSTMLGATPC